MKLKKLLVLGLALACIASISITATLAYLTADDSVTNTFTVGKVAITMDEKDTDDSTADADRDQANDYKIYPGQNYVKDPTIHVDEESENCYLFVTVDNGIAGIEAEGETTIAAQMEKNGWTVIKDDNGDNIKINGLDVYAYERIATKDDANVVIFESFTIADSVTNDELEPYGDAEIAIQAYAIQSEGFANATEAWTANNGQF